jgi:hypothetical protein
MTISKPARADSESAVPNLPRATRTPGPRPKQDGRRAGACTRIDIGRAADDDARHRQAADGPGGDIRRSLADELAIEVRLAPRLHLVHRHCRQQTLHACDQRDGQPPVAKAPSSPPVGAAAETRQSAIRRARSAQRRTATRATRPMPRGRDRFPASVANHAGALGIT